MAFKERLVQTGFEAVGEVRTIGRGWVVLEARKRERSNGGNGSIVEQLLK